MSFCFGRLLLVDTDDKIWLGLDMVDWFPCRRSSFRRGVASLSADSCFFPLAKVDIGDHESSCSEEEVMLKVRSQHIQPDYQRYQPDEDSLLSLVYPEPFYWSQSKPEVFCEEIAYSVDECWHPCNVTLKTGGQYLARKGRKGRKRVSKDRKRLGYITWGRELTVLRLER